MYNLTDMHLHSKFSWDAQQTIADIAEKSKTTGMKHVGVSEHIDFMDGHTKSYTLFEYEEYYSAVEKAKKIFPGILKGIEAGETHLYYDRFEKFLEGKKFDFIIGSVHMVGEDTPVYEKYFRSFPSFEDAYLAYFEEEYKLIKKGGFDIAAHLDIVHRRGGKFFKGDYYSRFKKEIDDILKAMISNKIALEVNTSGLRYFSEDILPKAEVVKSYIELGGDMITVGSDAHISKDTFFGIEKAYGILDGIGVKEITVFKDRKPIRISLRKF